MKPFSFFVHSMKLFTWIYLLGGILFYALHDVLSTLLGFSPSQDRFWVALTTSMMLMLSFVSWKSAQNPREKAFVQLHVLSKSVSVAGFALAALAERQHFLGYGVGLVVDLSILIFVVWAFRRSHG